ncbi:transmembrane protein 151B-like [Hyalella azteca]|uniref:Transmembrane protein 151B-like n=1 Tax=Hyalella azteca TaxID=294128 RepID=A0A979FUU7_HYAAZ|nr:transmembrane protein 151B-like [Hyalella azteca]
MRRIRPNILPPDPADAQLWPQRPSLVTLLVHRNQCRCLVLTLLIGACIAYIALCRVSKERSRSQCLDLYLTLTGEGGWYVAVACLVIIYVIYLVECCLCPLRHKWSRSSPAAEVGVLVESLVTALPVIWWKAVCYHYVRRSRHTTRFRDGGAFSTHEVFYQRINSRTAESRFEFSRCGVRDVSKKLVNLSRYPFLKLKFSKGFAFSNLEASVEFEEQRTRFFQEHESWDTYMEMREGLDLTDVGFKEVVLVRRDGAMPWYVHPVVFGITAALVLSWPLRMWIEFNTAHAHFEVTKLFGVNYPDEGEDRRVSRSSVSADSHDIELSIAENCSVAPSYSEALLMVAPSSSSSSRDANGNVSSSQQQPRPASVFRSPSAIPQTIHSCSPSPLVVYRPSPLPPRRPDDPFEGRWCCWPEGSNAAGFISPPCYEEALQVCQPLNNSAANVPQYRTSAIGPASYRALGQPISRAMERSSTPISEAAPEPGRNSSLRRSISERNIIQCASRWLFPRRSCHCSLEADL